MGRVLRFSAPGLCGLGLVVAGYSVLWLYADYQRNRVTRPTPIRARRVVPIHDGTYR